VEGLLHAAAFLQRFLYHEMDTIVFSFIGTASRSRFVMARSDCRMFRRTTANLKGTAEKLVLKSISIF